jgi:predicted RNase H-like HicB family nuclease
MMTKAEFLEMEYPVVVRPDRCTNGAFCYVAEHPDLPGCAAHGDTIKEARDLLNQARITYLKYLLAKGHAIPSPSPVRPREWQAGVAQQDATEWAISSDLSTTPATLVTT